MTSETKPNLSLTGILIEDAEQKGYTAFFAEFPEAVAEGDTEEEVQKNLFEALSLILEVKKEEVDEDFHGQRFFKKSFNLQVT